ncbi:MAG: hypothetical protein HY833_00270 [Candidatus Aenigmarchaeota archaeon]|nr:hypothetical protein [Candidatus Aenigmarchaeota archaeon]
MNNKTILASFVLSSLILASASAAQSSNNPTIFLSSNDVTFFNGDQDYVEATIKNNDVKQHVFTISVFPGTLNLVYADSTLGHVTLAPLESKTTRLTFSSQFDADFVPRVFSITAASTDDASLTATKEVVVHITRRSPVFVLSLGTNKFSYQPGETVNISSLVANQGGDSFDEFLIQTVITKDGEFIKRFETPITYLPEKSRNTFSNLYTFGQFDQPGVYSAELALKDASGQLLSQKSVNFKVGEVTRTSQQESNSNGIFEITNTITATNEGNAPTDIKLVAIVPSFAKEIFASDIQASSMEDQGSSTRVTWLFTEIAAGETVQVTYKLVLWKIWLSIIIIATIVVLAFKFVFTVKIMKRSRFFGPITKESEVPVTIEVVNRSVHEVRDVYVRDFIPPIAKIVSKFETMKPNVRETVGGTELTWKFDSLRAGEERVITYRLRPKMDIVGTLKLNPATVTYSNKRRQKKSTASGIVIVQTSQ